jgi:UDP-sugar transporter A1/2/3
LTALLGRFTRQENDKKDLYSIGEFILVSEFLKLIVSILFELMTGSENLPHNSSGSSSSRLEEFKVRLCHNPRDLFRMSAPAVCYWASNTLLYMAISNLSVPIFQVMSQSKLVITAVLSVLVLKRHYSSRQWACLVIISISLALITLEEKNAADISTPARTGSNGQFISGLFAMSFSITVNGPAKRKVAEKLLRVY